MRPASAFCCDECGHVHLSEHTVLDTFCPECEAPRENQTLIQCLHCGMPAYPLAMDPPSGWMHCDEDLDEECMTHPRVMHLRGLKRRKK